MHYMTVLVIEYESTAYQQYKMAKKKLGVFFQFFAREATLTTVYFPLTRMAYCTAKKAIGFLGVCCQ